MDDNLSKGNSDFKSELSSSKLIDTVFEENENLNEQFDLIKDMKKIKCTILSTGLKPTKQIYYHCSCDPNKIDPICEECSQICHKNHVLSSKLEGNIICACGIKGHRISSENQNSNEYKKECVFNEIEKISGRMVYYLTPDDYKICMFCNTFCSKKEDKDKINPQNKIKYLDLSLLRDKTHSNNENKKVYFNPNLTDNETERELNSQSSERNLNNLRKGLNSNYNPKMELPDCECRHENHFNLKNILDTTNSLGVMSGTGNFEDLNSNQLLNLIFISNSIYRNNYILFEEYASTKFNFKSNNFKLDPKIYMTSYFYSIMNFHNISKSFVKKLRYPNKKITKIFDFNLIGNLLSLNLEDNFSNWAFYNHILGIFRKCWLGRKFTRMTKFRINDLENLSILQRLSFIKVKYLNGKNPSFSSFLSNFIYSQENNLINTLLKFIEKIIRIGFTSVEGLEMYLTLSAIILRLSNYYLFTENQKIRYVITIENTLKHINTIMFYFRDSEKFRYIKYIIAKVLLKMTKTLIYLAYEENDSIIYKELFIDKENLSQEKLKNINFFHMKNEFGNLVSKIFIQILSLTQQEFEQFAKENYDERFRSVINDLLRYQNHLLALFARAKDSYIIGLRGSFISSKIYIDFLSNPNTEETSNNFGFNSAISSLENVYDEYMNFMSDKDNLYNLVLHFLNNFNTNYRDLIILGKTSPLDEKVIDLKFFIFYSEFLPCILKSLKILSSSIDETFDELITDILDLLNFFIEENMPNSKLLISDCLFYYLKEIPLEFSLKNFELINTAILNIAKYSNELNHTKSIIKRIYLYYKSIIESSKDEENLKSSNFDYPFKCLQIFLRICITLINDIHCINNSCSLEKIREILKEIINEQKFIKEFIDFIIKVNKEYEDQGIYLSLEESERNNNSEYNENNNPNALSNILFKWNITEEFVIINNNLFFRIFNSLLTLINLSFIDPNENEISFLREFLPKQKIFEILKNQYIEVNLRTELLKYLCKFYINFRIDSEKYAYYMSAISHSNSSIKIATKNNYNFDLYYFLNNIDTICNRDFSFDQKLNDLLKLEISNIKNIIENEKKKRKEDILIYLEHGIFLTLSIYFHKVYCHVDKMNGEEFLNIFELFLSYLDVKNYYNTLEIKSFNTGKLTMQLTKGNNTKKMKDQFNLNILNKHLFDSVSKLDFFKNYMKNVIVNDPKNNNNNSYSFSSVETTKESLYMIYNNRYSAFDYTYIHNIIELNLFDVIQKPNSFDLLSEYNKNEFDINEIHDKINEENLPGFKDSSKCDIELFLMKINYLYEKTKGNLSESSLTSALSEISVDKEVSYRYMLLSYLFLFSTNTNFYYHQHFAADCDFLIFKLLQNETTDCQKEIITLLDKKEDEFGENTKVNIMRKYADNLFDKITRILINNFNSINISYEQNYIIAFNIIKLFKFLCEEHNNYFQGYLIKTLTFKKEHIDSLIAFGLNINEKNYTTPYHNTQNISFFDVMLLTITKILLCAKWEKTQKDDENYNIDYLYDLLSAIVELLIEIVQGNTEENLSYLLNEDKNIGNDRIKGYSKNSKMKYSSNLNLNNEEDSKYNITEEITDEKNFDIFLTQIRPLIFLDTCNSKIIYRVRTDLMNFLISLLEEKNCNKKIKDLIISLIPIEEVIISISFALKFLYYMIKYPYLLENNNNEDDKIGSNENDNNESNNEPNEIKDDEDFFEKIFEQKFDKKMFKFYSLEYFNNEDNDKEKLSEYDAFIFSNTYFRFIKIISLLYKDSEAYYLIDKVNKLTKIIPLERMSENTKRFINNEIKPIDLVNDDELHIDEKFMEKYLIIKFFEEITQTVEIKTEDEKIQRVIFTVLPTIKNLSNETKLEFITTVNRESAYTKLNGMIEKVDLFKEEIIYKTKFKQSNIEKFFFSLNFYWIQVMIFFLSCLINIIIMLTVDGDTASHCSFDGSHKKKRRVLKEINYSYNYVHLAEYQNFMSNSSDDNYQNLNLSLFPLKESFEDISSKRNKILMDINFNNKNKERNLMVNSDINNETKNNITFILDCENMRMKTKSELKEIADKSIIKNQNYFNPLQIILWILCIFSIFLWCAFKLPLYYHIDKEFFKKKFEKDEKDLSFLNKIYIVLILSIKDRNHINTLIYISIVAFVSVINSHQIITTSLALLSIINIIPVLSNIITAMKLKYLELFSLMILSMIIIWAHSAIGFYLFNEDFAKLLENTPDNWCSDMTICFIFSLDYGWRARGGIGELMTRISYERDHERYYVRFIYDVIYFLLIIIIMLELVFGIIVETFRDLRINETLKEFDKANICFICGVRKDDLEKNRKSFKEHCEKVHNVWNYINYILRLKFSDSQDLNAINSYALENIENNQINWVPLINKNQFISLQDEDKSECDNSNIEEINTVNNENEGKGN